MPLTRSLGVNCNKLWHEQIFSTYLLFLFQRFSIKMILRSDLHKWRKRSACLQIQLKIQPSRRQNAIKLFQVHRVLSNDKHLCFVLSLTFASHARGRYHVLFFNCNVGQLARVIGLVPLDCNFVGREIFNYIKLT